MFLWNKKQNNKKSEVEISRWEGDQQNGSHQFLVSNSAKWIWSERDLVEIFSKLLIVNTTIHNWYVVCSMQNAPVDRKGYGFDSLFSLNLWG